MKKLLLMILIVCFVAAGGFVVFSACSDSHAHHLEYHAAKAPSCTEKGHKEYWQCTECGGFFEDGDGQKTVTSEGLTIFALGHDWSEWQYPDGYSCDESATVTRECARCHETENKTLAAGTHRWQITEYKEADCTHDGYVRYECDFCHVTHENILSAGHSMSHFEGKAATCTQEGNVEYYFCSFCERYFSDMDGEHEIDEADIIISALGHDWSEWTEDTAATCAKEGSRYRLCTSCGEVQREVIPAAGHQYDQTTHICSVCGDIQATQDLTFEFAYPAVYPGGSYVLTSTGENVGEIVLPATYNGKPVTGIAAGGVLSGVTSVQIPQTSTFYLYGGALADTVTQVRYAGDINGWAQLYFESGWAAGEYALFTLSGGVFVKEQNVSLTCGHIAAYAFEKNGGLGAVVLDGVQRVEQFAFASSSVVSFTAGKISALGYGAFAGCAQLKSADLSSSGITLLNAMTFAGCGLGRLKLPASLKSVAASAVPVRPDSLTFAGSREQWAQVEIGAGNALENAVCEADV